MSNFLINLDFVKLINFFFIGALAVLFTACPTDFGDEDLKKFQKNNNDLPDLVKENHEGITFLVSSMLNYDYNQFYSFTTNNFTRSNYFLALYLSVDAVDNREVEIMKFAFDEELEDVDAVHRHCVHKRATSLVSSFTSEKKRIPKSINLDGYIQVVEGGTYDYSDKMDYFIATFIVDDMVYVMQFIGKSGNMDYLYDDFLVMLKSVH